MNLQFLSIRTEATATLFPSLAPNFCLVQLSLTGQAAACRGSGSALGCSLSPRADGSPISDHSSEKCKFQHPQARSETKALVVSSKCLPAWTKKDGVIFLFVPTNWKRQGPPSHPARGFHMAPHVCSIYSQKVCLLHHAVNASSSGVVSVSSPSVSLVSAYSRCLMHVC